LLLFGFGLGLVLQYMVVRPLQEAAKGNCDAALRSYWPDNVFVRSLTRLADLDPHLLLHIFIPPLIYESASAIEWHVFFNLKWTALLLAVPGVIGSTYLLGFVVNTLYGNQPLGIADTAFAWPTNAGTLLGVILSATDPVAVVALLKELGVKEE
jgi:solute carrier family 9 (sodium/hydrogen exchanger), member 10/11